MCQVRKASGAEVIDADNAVALIQQMIAEMRAEKAGSSGNENRLRAQFFSLAAKGVGACPAGDEPDRQEEG